MKNEEVEGRSLVEINHTRFSACQYQNHPG